MPTFAELAGAAAPTGIDGFSLVTLLENPSAGWHEERMLFTHVGRWGGATPSTVPPEKFGGGPGQVSVRWHQYLQVYETGGWRLYDLKMDPGETKDLAASHAEVVASLSAAYEAWWDGVVPCLENESAWKTAPNVNPFRAEYWRQFGGQ